MNNLITKLAGYHLLQQKFLLLTMFLRTPNQEQKILKNRNIMHFLRSFSLSWFNLVSPSQLDDNHLCLFIFLQTTETRSAGKSIIQLNQRQIQSFQLPINKSLFPVYSITLKLSKHFFPPHYKILKPFATSHVY